MRRSSETQIAGRGPVFLIPGDLFRSGAKFVNRRGARRLIQRACGYRHTFKNGIETLQNDELTGARPGGVVRGGVVKSGRR